VSPAPFGPRFVGVYEDMCKIWVFVIYSRVAQIGHPAHISQKHKKKLSLNQGLGRLWNAV
jgi:hypothetical protein